MAGTRQSSRQAAAEDASPKRPEKSSPHAGSKRKAEEVDSPQGKRDRKAPKQQTLEETLENGYSESDKQQGKTTDDPSDDYGDQPKDIEMIEAAAEGEGTDKPAEPSKEQPTENASTESKSTSGTGNEKASANGTAEKDKSDKGTDNEVDESGTAGHPVDGNSHLGDASGKQGSVTESSNKSTKTNGHQGDGVVDHASDRKGMIPSNILEKGIIYFFTRGRVGIEDPNSVQDLQRTYFVLRPIPKDGKIGDGVVQDEKVSRLIAIPKKVLPKSGRDRFMVFVEKSGVSMKELKEEFFQGSEYETKTTGVRQTPPVAPIGEGVYALTTTGRTSHLVYMLTIPKDLSEVQSDMGLRERGSFVTSLKNPTASGPAYASLPEKPDFPEDFIKDFAGRSWMPVERPEYLNYPNAQLLLIGEGEDKFANALEPTEQDQKHDKETPQEELEKLEDEDQIRVEHLEGDDTVFSDLGISKKEYPDVMTTW